MKKLMSKYPIPGVLLIEQEGQKMVTSTGHDIGWNGERFYWPVLMLPELERSVMISLDSLRK